MPLPQGVQHIYALARLDGALRGVNLTIDDL
jgi:hypothetical protein